VLHLLELQRGQRMMERHRSHDAGRYSKVEGTRRQTDDVIRRQTESSSRGDAELSDRPIERNRLDEREVACARAIDRGRAKMQKYQQEAERYQDKERDTFEEFEKDFENKITKLGNSVVEVKSYASKFSGTYENEIDVENGKITGKYNRYFLPYSEEKLDFSEVIFNHLRLSIECLKVEMSEFNLKCWYGKEITNEDTKNTVELFFPEEKGKDGLVKEREKTFLAGTDAFIALAGTSTARSKFYLLAQHPEIFKGKKVTSITVIRHPDKKVAIEYEFGSQLEQEEKTRPND
jgi:hypothetical protein